MVVLTSTVIVFEAIISNEQFPTTVMLVFGPITTLPAFTRQAIEGSTHCTNTGKLGISYNKPRGLAHHKINIARHKHTLLIAG